MSRSVLRVALLGTAHVHVTDHLSAIAKDPKAVLAAVYRGASPAPIPLVGVPHLDTVSQAIRAADLAVVASTTAEHGDILRQVVAAGLPALVEKPLAATLAETVALATLIDAGAAPVTTAMFLRCAPALRRVRSLLATDAFGRLAGVHARFSHPGLMDGTFTGHAAWMTTTEHGGTGGFADLAVHLVDLLRWLRPDAPLTVRAVSTHRPGGHVLDSGGAALLDWGGVATTIHAGWTSRPGGVHLHLEGSLGCATVHGDTLARAGDAADSAGLERHEPPRAEHALTAFLGELRGHTCWRAPTTGDIVACARTLDDIARADTATLDA